MVKVNLHFKLYKKRLTEKNEIVLHLKKLSYKYIYIFFMSEPH